jgi:formylglycine-generating enzyme required for sulfatase activity
MLFVLIARPGNASRNSIAVAGPPDTRPKPMVNSIGMSMMRIPEGKFIMGSAEGDVGRKPHEGPQHEVTITRPFYMGKHEVTVGQFRAFVDATSYKTDGEREGSGAFRYAPNKDTVQDPKCLWHQPGFLLLEDQPVVCVSRNDATAFCQWLAKKEGKPYRLPTEAEWEYACRAGTMTPWHAGTSLTKSQAHFAGVVSDPAATGKPTKVGYYPPNAFGLHDMHGNVWEWVADWYDENYYRQSPPQDPQGPPSGGVGILRGGGWEEDADHARSAFRFAMTPSFRHVVIGFRVAYSE